MTAAEDPAPSAGTELSSDASGWRVSINGSSRCSVGDAAFVDIVLDRARGETAAASADKSFFVAPIAAVSHVFTASLASETVALSIYNSQSKLL